MTPILRLLLLALLLTGCGKNVSAGSERWTDTGGTAGSPPQQAATGGEAAATPTTGSQGDALGATYVGTEHCASCHQREYQSWRYSHHDLAMKKATDSTVLGNFSNAEFDHYGTRSRFYKQGGNYFVRTEGPDGELRDYPIAYTFGVHPLQQYLIGFPDGKLQPLTIAWDSRSKGEGGQRWFHLYPDEKIASGDELHWTGINQNWNFMCADCHSTNLQKNYDLASHAFDTTWSEINVACEACHGPASRHLQWVQEPNADISSRGFAVSYTGRKHAVWTMAPDTGIAQLAQPADTQAEMETCAHCHSRRATSFPGARPGDELLDNFNLSLLAEPLYHPDGQINEEVYVYGSFLQSKMHGAGVTCSNCHEPHSLQLRIQGNGVCAQCHLPEKFDTAGHHLHYAGSQGAQCVNCHMPAKTYMQVDARRDHSFRIPRPDLSDKLETPNACTGCHTDKTNSWAATVLEDKFGKPAEQHYGEAIYAGRRGLPGAEAQLMALVADETQPAIARATAVGLLPRCLSRESMSLLQSIAQGDEALLNLGLAQSLESVPPQIRPALAIPLLYDDRRVISALAANALAGLPMDSYPAAVQQQFARALDNYLESEKFNADRPESLANLAGLHAQRGNREQAEAFYRRALSIAPYYTPAYINLADLYRGSGREQHAEALLRNALNRVSEKAPIQHSLGMSLVRQQRKQEALEYLHQAADGSHASARYIYVYAIALNSIGAPQRAIPVLEQGLQRFPHNREILQALVSISRESGNLAQAEHYRKIAKQVR